MTKLRMTIARGMLAWLIAASAQWAAPAGAQYAHEKDHAQVLEAFLETIARRPDFPTKLSILKSLGELDAALGRMPLTGDARRFADYCAIARERARVEIEINGYFDTPPKVLRDAWTTCRLNYALAWMHLRSRAQPRPTVAELPE